MTLENDSLVRLKGVYSAHAKNSFSVVIFRRIFKEIFFQIFSILNFVGRCPRWWCCKVGRRLCGPWPRRWPAKFCATWRRRCSGGSITRNSCARWPITGWLLSIKLSGNVWRMPVGTFTRCSSSVNGPKSRTSWVGTSFDSQLNLLECTLGRNFA